jgi:hypothetical protein
MPSRLSSLLVRDGLVGVKRMEKAFQRQVIYGGSLDTILLEMSLIPEDRLVQYLALASGLPPAARDEGQAIEPAAIALIKRELAEQYRAVPVAIEGDAVRVLVCAPLEISELEDLADLLDRALQPLIVPEYRWNLVFAAAYGIDPPARFTQLARLLEGDPGSPAVGRAKSVIITESDAVAEPSDSTELTEINIPGLPDPESDLDAEPELDAGPGLDAEHELDAEPEIFVEPATDPEMASPEAIAGARLPQLPGLPGENDTLRLPGASRRPAIDDAARRAGAEDGNRPRRLTIVGLAPNRARTDARDSGPITTRFIRGRSGPRAPSAPITTEGRDEPLPIVRARELLETANDRDTVFLTLLRAARSRTRWAGLLTIQGGAAIGRVALAEPGLDAVAITTVLIPLDVVSPFRTVVSNHQSHIGPLASGDAGIDAMILRMGGSLPPSALILPIVLRDRVVAVVVAHRVQSDLRLVDVTELLPLATAASDALSRLIVKSKAAGYRAPQAQPLTGFEEDAVVTKRLARPITPVEEPSGWRTPALPLPAPLEVGTEVSIEAEPPTLIEDVVRAVETSPEGKAEDAIAEAVERAAETLGVVDRRFPGKLRVDRFAVSGRALRAAQYGGLLELLVRLGGIAGDIIVSKLAAPQRDIRFYAAVCAVELRPRNAVEVLAERLFDQDYGVRACAIEALRGYPPSELEQAYVRARRGIESTDPEVVGAAASAIVELGDVAAIGELIAAVERGGRSSEHARRALVALTAQDFGTSERKWRKWWENARKRHRIEWLIDGLSHKEDPIREAAIRDLRRLTGEYFGYHHDLPRREREAAADRWAAWWRETGHRRFLPIENERNRPTAKLPARED